MKNELKDGLPPSAERFFSSSGKILTIFLCAIPCVTALFVIIAPNCFRVGTAKDATPQQTLRNIHSAQAVYESGIGNGNYTSNLAVLGGGSNTNEVGLIDSTVVNAQTTPKGGYLLGEMKTVPRTATTPPRYSITIFPAIAKGKNRTGNDCYFVDETGIIRHSGRPDVPATAMSPPIGN
jgi:type IV pilus assembly protein PilA